MKLHRATIDIGERWLRARNKLALHVPSAVVPGSFNYILNPLHPSFRQARWSKPQRLVLDDRLIVGSPKP